MSKSTKNWFFSSFKKINVPPSPPNFWWNPQKIWIKMLQNLKKPCSTFLTLARNLNFSILTLKNPMTAKYLEETLLFYFFWPWFHIIWLKMLNDICINLKKYPKGHKNCHFVENKANFASWKWLISLCFC